MTFSNSPRRKEIFFQVLFLSIFLAIIVFILNTLGIFQRVEPGNRRVIYQVDGSASTAVITYTLEDGNSSGREEILVPWKSKSFQFEPGSMIILTTGNLSQIGKIRCTISVNGESWKQESASYPEDKVSCAGIIP